MILAHQLTKRFEDFTALRSLSCEIEKGCIYGMVGSNGAGKSTTLNAVAGVWPGQWIPVKFLLAVMMSQNYPNTSVPNI